MANGGLRGEKKGAGGVSDGRREGGVWGVGRRAREIGGCFCFPRRGIGGKWLGGLFARDIRFG